MLPRDKTAYGGFAPGLTLTPPSGDVFVGATTYGGGAISARGYLWVLACLVVVMVSSDDWDVVGVGQLRR